MTGLLRTPQGASSFVPGELQSGYYNDLTVVVPVDGGPRAGLRRFEELSADRQQANPVTIAQLGLGAWQLRETDAAWLDTVAAVARWLVEAMEPDGSLRFQFAMAHTFPLQAGWLSAMAQGEAASLLVRAAHDLADAELLGHAMRATGPLTDERSPVVVLTPEGPTLQEYPTTPPAHVLNGWVYALWGLHDVGVAIGDASVARAFQSGVDALAARLPRYRTAYRWSRYDLYPHPLANVASPYYHRLHVALIEALDMLAPRPALDSQARAWARASRNPLAWLVAIVRKSAFRVRVPRGRAAV